MTELWKFRHLVRQLAVRDLKVRYKVSVLGFFWSLLRPLLTIAVLASVFSMLDLQSRRYAVAYPTLLLASYMPWFFFSTTLLEGTHALLSNANLIKKVYAPRAVYPTAVVIANLVNFLFAMMVLLPVLYGFTSVTPSGSLLLLPLVILTHALFTLGLCWLISALNVLYRDTTQIMEFSVFVWFYLTPVLYDIAEVLRRLPDWAAALYLLNPMAGIIEWYRYALLAAAWTPTAAQQPALAALDPVFSLAIPYSAAVSLCLFFGGFWLFKRIETRVVDAL